MPKRSKLDFNTKLLIASAVVIAVLLAYTCVDKIMDNKNAEAYEAKIVELQQRIAELHKEYYLGSADFVFTTEPETTEAETEEGTTEEGSGVTENATDNGDSDETTDATDSSDETQADEAVNADVTVDANEADATNDVTEADTTDDVTEENTTDEVTEGDTNPQDIPDTDIGHAV